MTSIAARRGLFALTRPLTKPLSRPLTRPIRLSIPQPSSPHRHIGSLIRVYELEEKSQNGVVSKSLKISEYEKTPKEATEYEKPSQQPHDSSKPKEGAGPKETEELRKGKNGHNHKNPSQKWVRVQMRFDPAEPVFDTGDMILAFGYGAGVVFCLGMGMGIFRRS